MTNDDALEPPVTDEAPDYLDSLPPETLAETLDRYVEFHKRFVYHPNESTHDLAVLWAAHTHAMPTWRATPRLFIVAPEPGCGKTTQAEVISFGSHNGQRAGTTSTAGLFNIVTSRTVFLDENQNLFTSHPERKVLTAVINDGYKPGGHVLRKSGPIPVYGALAFAGIENGSMPQDTRQRCIPIQMRIGEPAEWFDPADHEDYQRELQARLAGHEYVNVRPAKVNRENEIWVPLLSIAEAAGADWPERVLRAQKHHNWPNEHNEQKAVLAVIREWFDEHHVDRVASSVLADYITRDDRLPNVTAKSLAGRMKGYGVQPRKISSSFYFRRDLEPVWDEWLPERPEQAQAA